MLEVDSGLKDVSEWSDVRADTIVEAVEAVVD